MATIGEGLAAIMSIPHLHRVINRAGGDAPAIGRPRHGMQTIVMATIGEDVVAISRIPYLRRFIPGTRGDTRAIRRPDHCIHYGGMSIIGHHEGSLRRGWNR